jgi:nucleobase:cation symporter-1, NCS1 family
MFGIIVGDYYLVKKQHIVIEDLYTMSPSGSLFYDNGWNRKALLALVISGAVSISMALLGAYGIIPNVGDWGWLIGAVLGALIHTLAMTRTSAAASVPAE